MIKAILIIIKLLNYQNPVGLFNEFLKGVELSLTINNKNHLILNKWLKLI